jgi:hypothetical protein
MKFALQKLGQWYVFGKEQLVRGDAMYPQIRTGK